MRIINNLSLEIFVINKKCLNLILLLLLSAVVVSGCTDSFRFFKKESPYNRYLRSLKEASLESTALGKDWIEAGMKVLNDSLSITLPYSEVLYFSPEKPRAVSYVVKGVEGQVLVVDVEEVQKQDLSMFIDVFEMPVNKRDDVSPEPVASSGDSLLHLEYEFESSRNYLVRMQPELLRYGQFKITLGTKPILGFPLKGLTSDNISSFWGADRDTGTRKHEGVDIFSKRGTPINAVADGYVSFVGWNRLGGNVVSVVDVKRGLSFYYAHLDKQLVKVGDRINRGDVVGTVGNTGNAITTAPHLHFGIYTFNYGAIDPLPYLQKEQLKALPVNVDLALLGKWVRIKTNNTAARKSPVAKGSVAFKTLKYEPVLITGGGNNWFRITSVDGRTAWLPANSVEPAEKPIEIMKTNKDYAFLYNNFGNTIIVDSIRNSTALTVLAKSKSLLLVKDNLSRLGWVSAN